MKTTLEKLIKMKKILQNEKYRYKSGKIDGRKKNYKKNLEKIIIYPNF